MYVRRALGWGMFGLWALAAHVAGVGAIACADDQNAVQTRLDRLEAELAALRSVTSETSQEATDDVYVESVVPRGSVFGGAEATILVPQAGTLSASGTVMGNPLGSIELTPDYPTFVAGRYWLGYRNASGLGGRCRFWSYSAHATGTLVAFPIETDLHVLALDAEATQVFDFGSFELDCSGGLRWGKISHSADVSGLLLKQSFDGLGPTAALWARRPLGSGSFSLVGGTRGSFLFGNNDYTAEVPTLVTATLTARNAAVMVYELQGGLEWSYTTVSGSRLFARAVGEAQMWQVPPVAFGLLDQTTGLVGATFSAGFDW